MNFLEVFVIDALFFVIARRRWDANFIYCQERSKWNLSWSL